MSSSNTPTRIYRIGDRLVDAPNQDVAVRVVVERTVDCRLATQKDLLELRDLGVQVIKHTDKFDGPKVGIPQHDLKAAVELSPRVPAAVRDAGEKYLDETGESATREGLQAAVLDALVVRSTERLSMLIDAASILRASSTETQEQGAA